jgi:methyltransferase of ATP-grasp peptide maturase system
MTEPDSDQAATLRAKLVAALHEQGTVTCPAWLTAARMVPRHLFVPAFFHRVDSGGQTMWHPLSSSLDPDDWLALAYSDQTLVTQIDNTVGAAEATGPVPAGEPTSSSTLPSVVLRMLEDLNVADTTTVVEVGTGTGYSTALMCQRLGDDRVTSIEVDPNVAARAAAALNNAGYQPRLIIGDGLTLHLTTRADRLIATCSVWAIPPAWIAQTKSGGQILAPIGGWLHACALARLDVAADGSASGHFLPGQISFMLARPHAALALDTTQWAALINAADTAPARLTSVGADVLTEWMPALLAQFAAPHARWQAQRRGGGPWIDYLVDTVSGSAAAVTPEGDGTYTVRQTGPIRLWDAIEASQTAWGEAGNPPIDRFTLEVRDHQQTIEVNGTHDPHLSWSRPAL